MKQGKRKKKSSQRTKSNIDQWVWLGRADLRWIDNALSLIMDLANTFTTIP